MPNARILHLGPNATYIPLTCVWVLRWVTQCFCVLRYQIVCIGWGPNPTPGPNASGFASQWNIGLSLSHAEGGSQKAYLFKGGHEKFYPVSRGGGNFVSAISHFVVPSSL